MAAMALRADADVEWRDDRIRARDDGRAIPIRTYHPPTDAPDPATVVWAHGGSWTGGSIEQWHPALTELARQSGACIVSVGYRLAPTHPFPAAVDDVDEVIAALYQQRTGDRSRTVAVGGDSAGATIATLTASRYRLTSVITQQYLVYPAADPSCSGTSFDSPGFPSATWMSQAWCTFTGRYDPSGSAADPLAAPYRGAAGAHIVVGSRDPLRSDGFALAEHLRRQHVAARVIELPDMEHGSFVDTAVSARVGLHEHVSTLIRTCVPPERTTC